MKFKKSEKKKAVTAKGIEQLLGNRFCPPAWAFLPQVRSSTGAGATRTADAIMTQPWDVNLTVPCIEAAEAALSRLSA